MCIRVVYFMKGIALMVTSFNVCMFRKWLHSTNLKSWAETLARLKRVAGFELILPNGVKVHLFFKVCFQLMFMCRS
jgi:hypothetical protein